MNLQNYKSVLEQTPEEVTEDVKLRMDILERIHELLELKFNGKQKLLAERMNKSEAEISKWLSGVQNFTTKTIAKLQVAFGEPIIAVCSNKDESTFAQVMLPYKQNHTVITIDKKGSLKECITSFEDVKYNSQKTANKDFAA